MPLLDVEHPADERRLDATFAALANETRRAILARLADGEADVHELAAPFDLSPPAISKHLKVLERAGLVERSRRAQYRPCSLNPAPLAHVAQWTDHYRPLWEGRLDRMAQYLDHLQGPPRERSDEETEKVNPHE